MKYKLKRMAAATLVVALSTSTPPLSVYARSFGDINSDHWAYQHINSLASDGIVNGRDNGNFDPDSTITRAEFFTMINNTFGFTDETEIHFSDVNPNAWYVSQVRRAIAAGYVRGFEDATLRPNNNITRAEVVVILNNILNLPTAPNAGFIDSAEIPSWAESSVSAVAEAGIIRGFPDGTFRPTNNMTRAESAVVLSSVRNNFLGGGQGAVVTPYAPDMDNEDVVISDDATLITSSFGTSEVQTIDGDVRIAGTSALEVQNLVINGDLVISESHRSQLVSLSNVTVNGAVYINSTNVHLLGSFDDVYVNQPNTRLRLRNSGGTTVENLTISESATGSRLTLDANTNVANAVINAARTSISGNGRIASATINATGVTVANNSIIQNLASGSNQPSLSGIGTGTGGGNIGGGGGGWNPTPPTQPPITPPGPPVTPPPGDNLPGGGDGTTTPDDLPDPGLTSDAEGIIQEDPVPLPMEGDSLSSEAVEALADELNNMVVLVDGQEVSVAWEEEGTHAIPIYDDNNERIQGAHLELVIGYDNSSSTFGAESFNQVRTLVVLDIILVGGQNLPSGGFEARIPSTIINVEIAISIDIVIARPMVTIPAPITLNLVNGDLENQTPFMDALNSLSIPATDGGGRVNWLQGHERNIRVYTNSNRNELADVSLSVSANNQGNVTAVNLTNGENLRPTGTYTLVIPSASVVGCCEFVVTMTVNNETVTPNIALNSIGTLTLRNPVLDGTSALSPANMATFRTALQTVFADVDGVNWALGANNEHTIPVYTSGNTRTHVANLVLDMSEGSVIDDVELNVLGDADTLATGNYIVAIPATAMTGSNGRSAEGTITVASESSNLALGDTPTTITLDVAGITTQAPTDALADGIIAILSSTDFDWVYDTHDILINDDTDTIATLEVTLAAGTRGNATLTLADLEYPIDAGLHTIIIPHDAVTGTDERNLTAEINLVATGTPVITSGNTFTATHGTAATFTIIATGTETIVFTLSDNAPDGVSIAEGASAITIANDVEVGTHNFTITATNDVGSATQNFTLTVVAAGTPIITSGNSTTVNQGVAGEFTLEATGADDIAFSLTGTPLDGVTIETGTSVLTIANTAAPGVHNLTIRATNTADETLFSEQAFTLTITPAVAPQITSVAELSLVYGVGGTHTITTTGDSPITLSYGTDENAPPTGVTLSDNTLTIANTVEVGTHEFTIIATNTNIPSLTYTQDFTLTVTPVGLPEITSDPTLTVAQGSTGQLTLAATAGEDTVSFSLTGTVPDGVTISESTSTLTIAATVLPGTHNFTVRATNTTASPNIYSEQPFTLTITPAVPPEITSANTMNAVQGTEGTLQLTFEGTGPIGLAFGTGNDAPPTGVSIAESNILTVANTVTAGTYTFTIIATNTNEHLTLAPHTQTFTLTVTAPEEPPEPDPDDQLSDFTAVIRIENGPDTTGTVGTPVNLTGTVYPAGSANSTIAWTITEANGTGATLNGNQLNVTSAGTVVVTASVANGTTVDTNFTQPFTITFTADPDEQEEEEEPGEQNP